MFSRYNVVPEIAPAMPSYKLGVYFHRFSRLEIIEIAIVAITNTMQATIVL